LPTRVLVADDSDLTRAVLRRYLCAAGFEVIEARDGAEAAVGAMREQPAVVVTDLEMPVMDGYQLARLLKRDPGTSHIRVVILTSHHEATSRFWGQHAGADAYLTKDELGGRLIETVTALATSPAQREESPEDPPGNPLEVLARVARHLDEGLMDATLINQVLEVGIRHSGFGSAAQALLELLAQVVDAELLGLAVVDDRGLCIHLYRSPDAARRVDPDSLIAFVAKGLGPDTPQLSALRVSGRDEEDEDAPLLDLSTCTWIELKLREATGRILVWPRSSEQLTGLPHKLLVKAAPHAGLVLDNVRLADHLLDISIHDGLTRLLNHRAILERLEEEMIRAERYQSDMSVVLCDVDRFKAINDVHGHLTGDSILKGFAERLKAGLRSSDLVGRYGGEEFLAILPGADLEAAAAVAERVCQQLIERPIMLPDEERMVSVTASFGVASRAEVDGPREIQELIGLADDRLYEAKADGRRCVKP
jgi:two-component system cell cycle response regulator